MSAFGMARMFAREVLGRSQQPRGATPAALLGVDGIIAAMEDGGASDGRTAAGYLYHSARISVVIAGSNICADFGCGTGVQLLQVAQLNPAIQFLGIDREPTMLARAKTAAERVGIPNVEWMVDDITRPTVLRERKVDAVISTMTLHNLETATDLMACTSAMASLIGTNGAVYIEDFARLKSPRSIDFFVGLNAPIPYDRFADLYRCSLNAAFTVRELREVATVLSGINVHTTFLVPFLVVIKTADRTLAPTLRARIHAMRDALPTTYKKDLDDLRKFFALGGLANDPFA
ncbi:MAG: methyltransferase domain-containing protein [Gammaproteobacteria bacterium]|nr:methyltransferase domain-containing protein [Gammaproteobacteria bacterium]